MTRYCPICGAAYKVLVDDQDRCPSCLELADTLRYSDQDKAMVEKRCKKHKAYKRSWDETMRIVADSGLPYGECVARGMI